MSSFQGSLYRDATNLVSHGSPVLLPTVWDHLLGQSWCELGFIFSQMNLGPDDEIEFE